jgi:hypothetical protein
VIWFASSRTYPVCEHSGPSAESRREFGIGADDCVSSVASVSGKMTPEALTLLAAETRLSVAAIAPATAATVIRSRN